jgi:hypothetical protein
VNTIERFVGTYQGAGAWFDSAGKSSAYRIKQTTLATANGFEIAFRHDFDDGTVVDARFDMTWVAPNIFRVEVSNASVGHGYLFDTDCHYDLKVGDAFVEASYRSAADTLEVFGSSTKNAEGHYIAWKETLRKVAV